MMKPKLRAIFFCFFVSPRLLLVAVAITLESSVPTEEREKNGYGMAQYAHSEGMVSTGVLIRSHRHWMEVTTYMSWVLLRILKIDL
jgi:hypothetical protein